MKLIILSILATMLSSAVVGAERCRPLLMPDLLGAFRSHWQWKHELGQELALGVPAHFVAAIPKSLPNCAAMRVCYCLHAAADPNAPHQTKLIGDPIPVSALLSGANATASISEPFLKCRVVMQVTHGSRMAHVLLGDLWLWPGEHRFVGCLYLAVETKADERSGKKTKCTLLPLTLVPSMEPGFHVALQTDRAGNVFTEGEPCAIKVRAFRVGVKRASSRPILEITNYLTKAKQSVPVALDLAREAVGKQVRLPIRRYGVYVVSLKIGHKELASTRVCLVPKRRDVSDESPFGVNLFQQQIRSSAFEMPLLARAGVKWIRPWLAWENCWWRQEPQPGEWRWSYLDTVLDRCDRLGLSYQYMFWGSPASAAPESITPEGCVRWASYAKAIVSRYRGRVRVWEAWNEPNPARVSARQFLDMARSQSLGIRAADPKAMRLGLGYAPTDFLRAYAREGGLDYCDAVSTHIYFWGGSPEQVGLETALWRQRAVLLESGRPDIKLWLNEIGYSACDLDPEFNKTLGVDEIKQAWFLVREFLLALATGYTDKVMWFCSIDPRDPRAGNWDAAIGVMYPDYSPKLSYVALAALCRQMGVPRIVGRIEAPDPVRAYAWDVGGQPLVTAWSVGSPTTFRLPIGRSAPAVFDIMGNPMKPRIERGSLALALDGSPVYVHGIPLAEVKARLASYQLQADIALLLDAGGEFDALAGITGVTRTGRIRVRFRAPAGVAIAPSEKIATCAPGKDTLIRYRVRSDREMLCAISFARLGPNEAELELREGRTVFRDDFEGATNGFPRKWQPDESNNPNYVWDAGGYGGGKCLRVNREAGSWRGFRSVPISVRPNARYVLSFRARYSGKGENGAFGYVRDLDNNRNYEWLVINDWGVVRVRSRDWTSAQAAFRTSSNATKVSIVLQTHGHDKDGDVWFDNVRLTEID